jgi:hypothetical protein
MIQSGLLKIQMPMQHTGNVYMLLSSPEKIQKSFYDESVEMIWSESVIVV